MVLLPPCDPRYDNVRRNALLPPRNIVSPRLYARRYRQTDSAQNEALGSPPERQTPQGLGLFPPVHHVRFLFQQQRFTVYATTCRFKYPTVVLTALYYAITFTLGSILPAVTSATLFHLLYKFTASQTGLALGFGTLIGSTLGELLGGIVVDRSMYLSRKGRKTNDVLPEVRCVP